MNMLYNAGRQYLAGGFDWTAPGADVRVMLLGAGPYAPDASHLIGNLTPLEAAGAGYARKVVNNRTVQVDAAAGVVRLHGDDVSWAGLDVGTSAGAVLVVDGIALAWLDLYIAVVSAAASAGGSAVLAIDPLTDDLPLGSPVHAPGAGEAPGAGNLVGQLSAGAAAGARSLALATPHAAVAGAGIVLQARRPGVGFPFVSNGGDFSLAWAAGGIVVL